MRWWKCVTQRWALHVVIKRQSFTFYICSFSISIHSFWDTNGCAFENERLPCWHSASCFDFEIIVVIGMRFCTDLPNFIRIWRSATELWRYVHCPRWRPHGSHIIANLLPLSSFMTSRIYEGKSYLRANFDQISQSMRPRYYNFRSVMLKFYSWFRFWPFRRHRYVILHRPAKFYANYMISDRVMTSCRFSKMVTIPSQIYFRFPVYEGTKLFTY